MGHATRAIECASAKKDRREITNGKMRRMGEFADYRIGSLRLLFVAVLFEKSAQPVATARMAQFAQRFGFDLADALASDREMLADLFERVLAAIL